MAEITIPVPDDKVAAFLEHVGRWLGAPAGATWTWAPPPTPTPVPWSVTRHGEFDVAAEVWDSLSAEDRKLLDVVQTAPPAIEAKELAKVLARDGVFSVMHSVGLVNAACAKQGREPCLVVSTDPDMDPVVRLVQAAGLAFARDP